MHGYINTYETTIQTIVYMESSGLLLSSDISEPRPPGGAASGSGLRAEDLGCRDEGSGTWGAGMRVPGLGVLRVLGCRTLGAPRLGV